MLALCLSPLIWFGGFCEYLVSEPPVVYVDRDDFPVAFSCRLAVAPGAELKDLKNDGLVRVVGHNIQVDATKFSLKGDQGIGVRILSNGVHWNGGTIEGFSVGMQVSGNDLVLTDMVSRSCEVGVQITSERFRGSDLHLRDGFVGLKATGSNSGILEDSVISRMGRSGVHLDTANEWKIHTNAISSIYGGEEASGITLTSSGRNHSIRGNVFDHTEYGISLDTGTVNLGMDMAEDARRRGLDWPPPGEEINLFRGQGFQDILCTENIFRNHQAEAFKLRGVSGLRLFGNQCFGPGPGLTLDLAEDLQFGQNRMQGNRPHAVMIRDCGVSRMDSSEFSGDRQGLVVLNPTGVEQLPPWAWAHLRPSRCTVTDCIYEGFEVALDLREGSGAIRLGGNRFTTCDRSFQTAGTAEVTVASGDPEISPPAELSSSAPIQDAQNEHLRLVRDGKPWNLSDSILTLGTVAPGFVQFVPTGDIRKDLEFSFAGEAEMVATENQDRITIRAIEKDRFERWKLEAGGQTLSGVLTRGWWKGFMWAYTADPVTSYQEWRNEAETGWVFQCREPVLDFGRQSPGDLPGIFPGVRDAGLPRDGFGLICKTERWVPAGRWILQVEANDGVRVEMDDRTVVDAWDSPTQQVFTHTFEVPEESVHQFSVEWFERTGLAYLRVTLTPQSE